MTKKGTRPHYCQFHSKKYTEFIFKIVRWKRSLEFDTIEDLIEGLREISGIDLNTHKNEKQIYLTQPYTQPFAHLAAYYERWDLLKMMLDFCYGAYINPFHKNKYRETLSSIISKKELKNPLALECYERVLDMENDYCRECLMPYIIYNCCENCSDSSSTSVPLVEKCIFCEEGQNLVRMSGYTLEDL